MDIPLQFTFFDFKTEENYLALQNKFLGYCDHNGPFEGNLKKVEKDDFTIIYKSIDPLTDEEDFLEYSFIDDFIIFNIPKLAKGYINYFKGYIENVLLNDNVRIKLAAEIQLKRFFDLLEIINKAEYLIKKIKVILQTQINIVIEYLKEVHIHPNFTIDNKFIFNLNKTDVLVLFLLMRDKKIINCPYDYILGYLLERNCLYLDGDKYTPIKKAGKVVNDFKNANRTIQKSVKRLKDIFNNDEFYELEAH